MDKEKLTITLIIIYGILFILLLPLYFDRVLVPIVDYSFHMSMKGTYIGDLMGYLSIVFMFIFGMILIPLAPILLIAYLTQQKTTYVERHTSHNSDSTIIRN